MEEKGELLILYVPRVGTFKCKVGKQRWYQSLTNYAIYLPRVGSNLLAERKIAHPGDQHVRGIVKFYRQCQYWSSILYEDYIHETMELYVFLFFMILFRLLTEHLSILVGSFIFVQMTQFITTPEGRAKMKELPY